MSTYPEFTVRLGSNQFNVRPALAASWARDWRGLPKAPPGRRCINHVELVVFIIRLFLYKMRFFQIFPIALIAFAASHLTLANDETEMAKLISDSLLSAQNYQEKWTIKKVAPPDPGQLKATETEIQEKIDALDKTSVNYSEEKEKLDNFLAGVRKLYGGYEENREVTLSYVNENKWRILVQYSHLDKDLYTSFSTNGSGLVMIKDVGQRKITITDDINGTLVKALPGLPQFRVIKQISKGKPPQVKIVDDRLNVVYSSGKNNFIVAATLNKKDFTIVTLKESILGRNQFSIEQRKNGWCLDQIDFSSGNLTFSEEWRLRESKKIVPSSIQDFSEEIEPGYLVDIVTEKINKTNIQSQDLRIEEIK